MTLPDAADAALSIRPYESADHHDATALFLEENERLGRAFPHFDFSAYIARSLDEEFAAIERYYAARGGGFWVAHRAGAFCGMFGLERRDGGEFELRRMYVASARRGEGVAAALLRKAERLARERGAHTMYLETSELQPRAVSFYKKHGYAVDAAHRPAAQTNKTVGGGVLRYEMRKRIDA